MYRTNDDYLILLRGTVGSTAYGLNHAGSDIDTLGMFVYSPQKYFNLSVPDGSIVTNDPDITLHEVTKYCGLALKCNPTATELLWLNEYTTRAYYGDLLISLRTSFLSEKAVREAYLGYAKSQLTRLVDRDWHRAAKHAKHMARLTRQGMELYTTGNLTVKVDDPEWYRWFMDQDSHYWADWYVKEEDKFRNSNCILPASPNYDAIRQYVYETRMEYTQW